MRLFVCRIHLLPRAYPHNSNTVDASPSRFSCENSTERMMEFAATLDPKCKPTALVRKGAEPGAVVDGVKEASWRDFPVAKRLEHALIKGIDEVRSTRGRGEGGTLRGGGA